MKLKRASGFSLLEAIVAMTLVAIAGLALFSWINASFDSINRLDAATARARAQLNALEWMKTVNPMVRPSGVETQGSLRIEWESRELAPAQRSLSEMNTPGLFVVALYEVTVKVEQLPSVPRFVIVLRQMGYRRG
jgi:general secretion pathway protein I